MRTTTPSANRVLLPAALFAAAATGLLLAGPPDPPAGPVGPTYKTLTEVEPRIAINAANTPGDADSLYKITQPGSYYLTGNITGVSGKHGIEIVATGVTLDLTGFELLGVPGSLDGITATVGVNNVEVRNGSVRSWGDEGLDFTNGGSIGVADVCVLSFAGFGISVNQSSTVKSCRASFNGTGGIVVGGSSTVTGCTAQGNTGGGILAWVGCAVTSCTALGNTGVGINAPNGSTVTGCTTTDNSGSGILAGSGCTVTGCSAFSEGAGGIVVGTGSTISGCSASGNTGHGFSGTDGITVSNCTARNNSLNGISMNIDPTISACTAGNNTGDGIRVIAGGAVSGCTATSNNGDGISAGPLTPATVTGTLITACDSTFNGGDGIQVFQRCSVTRNFCGSNAVGIRALETDNTIEGNTVNRSGGVGITVVQATNIIIGNRAKGNLGGPYSIFSPGNLVGTIVTNSTDMNAATNSLVNIAF